MAGKDQKIISFLFALLCVAYTASAQNNDEQADSLVRLMKGTSVQLIERDGQAYRKAVDATFLHNGTYLICDTALWNVNAKMINAEGHVQIIQDETVLTSERLDYSIDENLARFRGGVVQLQDKQRNTLRTRHLDYNTKDSIAIFRNGASMRDKDGQIIESLDGSYSTPDKVFTFSRRVNMFTDSVFVKTDKLTYKSEKSLAEFHNFVDFWKDGNMMSADGGWYERSSETFFFEGHVHAMSENQEAWSKKCYFFRSTNDIELLDDAQVQDTTRNVAAVADYIHYCDSLSRVEMRDEAAFALKTNQNGRVDTLYFGADTIIYHTVMRCDVDSAAVKDAEGRIEEILTDPVALYRKKAAEAAAAAAAEAAAKDPNLSGIKGKKDAEEVQDTLASSPSPTDSLAVVDTVAAPLPDSTKVGFLTALKNVKAYRKDIQLKCDSLRYTDLDSIARFYIDPVIWNDSVRQYSSDSIFVLIRNSGMDRASLKSNAMVVTQEDTTYYDQIKGAEVLAFFDSTSALERFDALGGATALFFLKENDAFATANSVECKMLSGVFVKGDLDKVFYFDNPKSNAFPVAQMKPSDMSLKGFSWQADIKPVSKRDVTKLELKPSERLSYARHEKASFEQTDIYFPGYIESVYRGIAIRDSIKALPPPPPPVSDVAPESETAPADSTVAPVDSLKTAVVDSVGVVRDSLAAPSDSLSVQRDSVSAAVPTTRDIRRAEREAKEKARQEAKEKRWKELDERDAARKEARQQKKLEKKRARTRREILRRRAEEEREQLKLEKYRQKFEKKKLKKTENGEID